MSAGPTVAVVHWHWVVGNDPADGAVPALLVHDACGQLSRVDVCNSHLHRSYRCVQLMTGVLLAVGVHVHVLHLDVHPQR